MSVCVRFPTVISQNLEPRLGPKRFRVFRRGVSSVNAIDRESSRCDQRRAPRDRSVARNRARAAFFHSPRVDSTWPSLRRCLSAAARFRYRDARELRRSGGGLRPRPERARTRRGTRASSPTRTSRSSSRSIETQGCGLAEFVGSQKQKRRRPIVAVRTRETPWASCRCF